MKEYTLNHTRDPTITYKVYSLIEGFWKVWVEVAFGVCLEMDRIMKAGHIECLRLKPR